jgi:hypothetical protein
MEITDPTENAIIIWDNTFEIYTSITDVNAYVTDTVIENDINIKGILSLFNSTD